MTFHQGDSEPQLPPAEEPEEVCRSQKGPPYQHTSKLFNEQTSCSWHWTDDVTPQRCNVPPSGLQWLAWLSQGKGSCCLAQAPRVWSPEA